MSKERVTLHRMNRRRKGFRTIELTLRDEHIELLDALAAKNFTSRNAWAGNLLSVILEDLPVVVRNGKLYDKRS